MKTITPQDIFNLILEDTHSAFTGIAGTTAASNKNQVPEEDLIAVSNRRESRQSYKHLMLNLSSFRAIMQPLQTPYLVRMRSEEVPVTFSAQLDDEDASQHSSAVAQGDNFEKKRRQSGSRQGGSKTVSSLSLH